MRRPVGHKHILPTQIWQKIQRTPFPFRIPDHTTGSKIENKLFKQVYLTIYVTEAEV